MSANDFNCKWMRNECMNCREKIWLFQYFKRQGI